MFLNGLVIANNYVYYNAKCVGRGCSLNVGQENKNLTKKKKMRKQELDQEKKESNQDLHKEKKVSFKILLFSFLNSHLWPYSVFLLASVFAHRTGRRNIGHRHV